MEKPEKILSTALKLFVTYGFHGTPTSRIAKDAGVSNGTLFHYFKTKNELVVSLYKSIKEELNLFLSAKINEAEDSKDKFRKLFVHSITWALAHQDKFYFIQQFHFSPHLSLVPGEVLQKQAQMHMDMIQEGVTGGLLKPMSVDLLASLAGNQINGMYLYLSNNNMSEEEKKKLIFETFDLTWAMIANSESNESN